MPKSIKKRQKPTKMYFLVKFWVFWLYFYKFWKNHNFKSLRRRVKTFDFFGFYQFSKLCEGVFPFFHSVKYDCIQNYIVLAFFWVVNHFSTISGCWVIQIKKMLIKSIKMLKNAKKLWRHQKFSPKNEIFENFQKFL